MLVLVWGLVVVVIVMLDVVTKLISCYFSICVCVCLAVIAMLHVLLIDLEVINLTPLGSRFRYKDSLLESIWFQIGDSFIDSELSDLNYVFVSHSGTNSSILQPIRISQKK